MNYPPDPPITRGDADALTIIRIETALSRFPVHRLAKKGTVQIEVRNQSSALLWEVSYNSKFGQPGPLAYKIDTLIVNRRIEEAGKPTPKCLKLGSLREICQELGISEGGGTKLVKNALHQNASSYITAKISYQTVDKAERWAEIADTRYGVVFTGENLPDGKEADAVYLVLHDFYRTILDEAVTRPLDYDYMKALPPAAQRFYEIASYQIYGALRLGNPRAKLLYSQYCLLSTATRYFDFDHMKKQMWKVHHPHMQSGYLAKVNYESTTDREGRPDWFMYYLPGPNAAREFREFTGNRLGNRRKARERPYEPAELILPFGETPERTVSPPEPTGLIQPATISLTPEPIAVSIPDELRETYELLCSVGFDSGAAQQLCRDPFTGPRQQPVTSAQERAERIRRQCAWIMRRKSKTLGMLRRSIEENYDEPGARVVVKPVATHPANLPELSPANARQSHEKVHRSAYHAYLVQLLQGGLEKVHSEAYSAFREREERGRLLVTERTFLKKNPEKLAVALSNHDCEEAQLKRFRSFLIEQSHKEQRVLGVLTFWEWDAELNPNGLEKSAPPQEALMPPTEVKTRVKPRNATAATPADEDSEEIRALINLSFGLDT